MPLPGSETMFDRHHLARADVRDVVVLEVPPELQGSDMSGWPYLGVGLSDRMTPASVIERPGG
jgi:hypothetical protein